ncbi:MAG: glycosyltransferase, partial [Candidatus Nanoarchaeia archaeon]|nr:glycosyltransferase [Candidatus Nanoarchaeia archaeon]
MNILLVAPDMKVPGTHGGSNHVMEVSRALKSIGHYVEIIANFESDESFEDMRIHKIKKTRAILIFSRTKKLVSKLVSSKKFDLVYERARIFGGAGCYVAKKKNIPCILEVNDPMVDAPLIEGRISLITALFAAFWENKMFNWATRIITQNKVMTNVVDKNKIKVITNGANPEELKPLKKNKALVGKYGLERSFVFAYIGSFGKWHGTEIIIEAFNKVLKKNKSLKLLMIGDGPSRSICEDMCNKYGIKNNVIFTGDVGKNEIKNHISVIDSGISVHNKEYPPFRKLGYYFSPIKIFEYLSMAKPVILSKAANTEKIFNDGE